MKVGDLVRVDDGDGAIGVVLQLVKGRYSAVPTAMVLVDKRVVKFDREDLWVFHEDRRPS